MGAAAARGDDAVMITVVIVDDHAAVRSGLFSLLWTEPVFCPVGVATP